MTSFGDPNAPKFCYGRKEDTPVNWDLNWKNQIDKEKREMKAREHKAAAKALAGASERAGLNSSRMYHPAHVTIKGPNPLGRMRMGVCGTLIHEDDADEGAGGGAGSGAPMRGAGGMASARTTASQAMRMPSARSKAWDSGSAYASTARSSVMSSASKAALAAMESKLRAEHEARSRAEARAEKLARELSVMKATAGISRK